MDPSPQPPPLSPGSPPVLPYGGLRCPQCGQVGATKVGFTWWGGVLGPKLLNHVKCTSCGCGFNGKTGQSNTAGIVIYTVVLAAIFAVIGFLLFAGVGM
jgi:hypothetical protein